MPHYSIIKAEFALVTPCFLGGANHAPKGIDPKSLKSAIRKWWRALYWRDFLAASGDDDMAALREMHKSEAHLFGEESKKDGAGQGVVQVVLRKGSSTKWQQPTLETLNKLPGITYLLGQGLYDYKNGLTRTALNPHSFFVDFVLYHRHTEIFDDKDKEQIVNALKTFGLLGGLGSRQNRGFGSIALRAIDGTPFVTDIKSYQHELNKIFNQSHSTIPLIPAFSTHAKCRVISPNSQRILVKQKSNDQVETMTVRVPDTWTLLSEIGKQFMLERSWGRKRKRDGLHVTDEPHVTTGNFIAEQNYSKDHDLIKEALGGQPLGKFDFTERDIPIRSVYGLPYNFGKVAKTTLGMNVLLREAPDLDPVPTRRASFFHIHMTTINDLPVAVLYTLPSKFLPDNVSIEMGKLALRNSTHVEFDFSVVDRFLNRFPSAITIPTPNV